MCSCTVGIIRKMFSNTLLMYCKVIVSFPLCVVSELLKRFEQHIPEQLIFDVHAAPTFRRDAHEHTEVRGTTLQPGEHVNAAKTLSQRSSSS